MVTPSSSSPLPASRTYPFKVTRSCAFETDVSNSKARTREILGIQDYQVNDIGKQSNDTKTATNGYLCMPENPEKERMIRKIKELYNEYKPYVRVDLIMYGVTVLLIIIYFIVSVFL